MNQAQSSKLKAQSSKSKAQSSKSKAQSSKLKAQNHQSPILCLKSQLDFSPLSSIFLIPVKRTRERV
jgi:hypothetical protein